MGDDRGVSHLGRDEVEVPSIYDPGVPPDGRSVAHTGRTPTLRHDRRSMQATQHGDWDAAEAAAVVADHAGLDGAALPVLHALQERFGHVPEAAVPIVAEALNLSRADVHGIVSFYHDFRRHPPGRHVVKLCRAEACQAVGGAALADHARLTLGVDWHGTTADGAVTLEPVFCLGLCACGPAALIDGEPAASLDAAALDVALAELRG